MPCVLVKVMKPIWILESDLCSVDQMFNNWSHTGHWFLPTCVTLNKMHEYARAKRGSLKELKMKGEAAVYWDLLPLLRPKRFHRHEAKGNSGKQSETAQFEEKLRKDLKTKPFFKQVSLSPFSDLCIWDCQYQNDQEAHFLRVIQGTQYLRIQYLISQTSWFDPNLVQRVWRRCFLGATSNCLQINQFLTISKNWEK